MVGQTKDELLDEITQLKRVVSMQRGLVDKRRQQTRLLRTHLLQMRNKLDYLLKHPYCQSYSTRSRKK